MIEKPRDCMSENRLFMLSVIGITNNIFCHLLLSFSRKYSCSQNSFTCHRENLDRSFKRLDGLDSCAIVLVGGGCSNHG